MLQCLPKNKWGPKVTAIKEAENLKALALDDFLGKLLTHETHLKEDEEENETQFKKGVAFKTGSEDTISSKEESSEEDEDTMATIANGLKNLFKSKKFDLKKFYKKGSSSSKNEKFSKGMKFSNNKNDSNLGPCFGCGLPGHILKVCPVLQMNAEKRKQKANKEFRKAMIAAWSDSDSSDSDKEEGMANLCLMANDV